MDMDGYEQEWQHGVLPTSTGGEMHKRFVHSLATQALKAGLHVRRKHTHKHEYKPRVEQDDAIKSGSTRTRN